MSIVGSVLNDEVRRHCSMIDILALTSRGSSIVFGAKKAANLQRNLATTFPFLILPLDPLARD